jgi:3-deoxy-manno-octulosonate cytidylyltransferase (CMP-KDO synthetase)
VKNIIVIPARLASTRLKDKVILDLHGKSVVHRAYEQALKAKSVDAVYIATDSQTIVEHCKGFTDNVVMTDESHTSGTDRVAEVVKNLECENIVNVQGDEPFMDPTLIDSIFEALEKENQMVSAMHKIELVEDLINPNIVKVIIDKDYNSIYFSRSVIPHHRDEWETLINHHKHIPEPLSFFRHLGIYGYKKEFLLHFTALEPTYLERIEKLEQLRVVENGYKIKMVETEYNSIGIDTDSDYQKALQIIKEENI